MMEMTTDIATLAAIVAALTGVAKGFGVPNKLAPIVAMAFSALFVFLPNGEVKTNLLSAVVVGLMASGAYSYAKTDNGGNKQ
ncbi:hypothetical protein [Brevibacillus laterosporus]|uniref:hypothetical protein n=1 Tax=Brevibacillus laterosporus TaxID=1465 RepID=UPI000CE4FA20|nr:hypothetical protein [Brevibacillus laterosporus]MED1667027.1 hypothetical protein [Brevibacillus laterosporus]MED1718226.1 hypothetical protein [Brevibacillus laterosporus]PPA82806.1 hypothetical protein C4A76_21025 [Brevibacillus laterosporus]